MSVFGSRTSTGPSAATKLAIIGGRLEDDNRQVYREMRRLAEGRILVFPTASSEPYEVGEETKAAFQIHGFDVDVAHVSSENAHESAYDPQILEMIENYGSVYFTGGDQAKIFEALIQNGAETPVLKAIRKATRKGGLLAGSSAGAAMMSSTMIMGGTSFEAMASGVTDNPEVTGILLGDGLGFFKKGIVDQHFIKRGRLARLVVALAHAGERRGFGVDENTALLVEDGIGKIVGEYGVFCIDIKDAKIDLENRNFENIRLDYLDDGDMIDLKTFSPKPSEAKRKVKRNEIAYRAPANSQRNAFGAYALYDLVARLVLGDQKTYSTDELISLDPKSGVFANVAISRIKRKSRCLVSTPETGLRITAINLSASMKSEVMAPAEIEKRRGRGVRYLGMDLNERSRIILLGSSPIYYQPDQQTQILEHLEGPVGVIAAASSEAGRVAREHVEFFRSHGVEAVDLKVTLDTIDYTAKDPAALEQIEDMKTIFLCGGNQIRLVDTLLHRGEESPVLRAIASAYAHGAALVASSGAASAMSAIMLAGGSTSEALRYGVASGIGHDGIVVQQGIGLFPTGLIDQNMLTARRLGRLAVACAEENERYGFGICEDSAIVATKSGNELRAMGRHGFVQIETDPVKFAPQDDRFIAKGIKLRMIGPGDVVNLQTDHVRRGDAVEAAKSAFDRMTADLMREGVDIDRAERLGRDPSARHAIGVRLRRTDPLTAILDLECAREEHDD